MKQLWTNYKGMLFRSHPIAQSPVQQALSNGIACAAEPQAIQVLISISIIRSRKEFGALQHNVEYLTDRIMNATPSSYKNPTNNATNDSNMAITNDYDPLPIMSSPSSNPIPSQDLTMAQPGEGTFR